jgi:NADH dehydrogenase
MKKIVIIGGGFGGFNCALGLEREKDFEIILIDPSDHFTYIPLIHEVAVGEIPENFVKIYFNNSLKRTKHHKSKVVKIFFQDKKVKLEDNLQLSYDYLIIACGSYSNKFIEGTESLQTLKTLDDAFKVKELLIDFLQAGKKSICVIGEGSTGTELVSEISSLLSSYNKEIENHHFLYFKRYFTDMPKADILVKRKMKQLGVYIHPQEPVNKVSGQKVLTKKGKYNFDLILVCTGVKPNVINSDINFVEGYPINDYCILKGFENVYAIGDVSKFKYKGKDAPNFAQTAKKQANFVRKDIIKRENNKKRKKIDLKIIGPLISVGTYYAFGNIFNNIIIRGFPAWWSKKTYYFYDIWRITKSLRLLKIYILSTILPNIYFKKDRKKGRKKK